ncbi:hypothetical protein [Pseudogemmobacter sonorensis]|uniref:hypothetical protein n=1 Tax=Pseudogemmobacter sonorensis TaxID=2989681 RepID=UPI003697DFCC
MAQHLKDFITCEDGAMTIDWVVLTAAIVGLQIGLMVYQMRGSMQNVTDGISGQVETASGFLTP